MAQRFFVGKSDFRIDRTLGYPIDDIFNRLFGSNDAHLRIDNMIQTTIYGGGFARTGRPRKKQHTAGQFQSFFKESLQHAPGYPDILDFTQLAVTI